MSDAILVNGAYRPGVSLSRGQGALDGRKIDKALRLRGFYTLPLIGPVLRNHWAKRNGAILN